MNVWLYDESRRYKEPYFDAGWTLLAVAVSEESVIFRSSVGDWQPDRYASTSESAGVADHSKEDEGASK